MITDYKKSCFALFAAAMMLCVSFAFVADDSDAVSQSITFNADEGTLTKGGDTFTDPGAAVNGNVLTLTDVDWYNLADDALVVLGDAIIEIYGDVYLTADMTGSNESNAIYTDKYKGNIIIRGDGNLHMTATNNSIICESFTIDGGVFVYSVGAVYADSIIVNNGTLCCEKYYKDYMAAIFFNYDSCDFSDYSIKCKLTKDDDWVTGEVVPTDDSDTGTIGVGSTSAYIVLISNAPNYGGDDDNWYFQQYLDRNGTIYNTTSSSDDDTTVVAAVAAAVAALAVICLAAVAIRKN